MVIFFKMVFRRMLICLFVYTSVSLTPKTNIDKAFMRHTYNQIDNIFDILYQYSCEKSGAESGIAKERFVGMGQNLWKCKQYINKRKDDMVYLGWTPLLNDNTLDYEVLRNDNNIVVQDTVSKIDHAKLPLYFVFLEVMKENKTINVEKIVHNPSLDIKIPPRLLKSHLECLAVDSNVSIDFSNLRFYDSGRWYLEFLYGDC